MRKKILTPTALLLTVALLFAACAAPQSTDEPPTTATQLEVASAEPTPFTPQEIANMTQGLVTVGDFVARMPAVEYSLLMSFGGDLLISFYNQLPQWQSSEQDWPFLELRVRWDIGSDDIYYVQTLSDELLAQPATLSMFRLNQPNMALTPPRDIDVGAPAQAVLESFSCASLRQYGDGSEYFIATEYPPNVPWDAENWWLSYGIENDVISYIFFRHAIAQ
ncbi:MAG: hypothetical protein FWD06_05435 [Oscillospiraceae bacterium]|nr:hypothetical protein [Oscillospiraceae bacterium]